MIADAITSGLVLKTFGVGMMGAGGLALALFAVALWRVRSTRRDMERAFQQHVRSIREPGAQPRFQAYEP